MPVRNSEQHSHLRLTRTRTARPTPPPTTAAAMRAYNVKAFTVVGAMSAAAGNGIPRPVRLVCRHTQ